MPKTAHKEGQRRDETSGAYWRRISEERNNALNLSNQNTSETNTNIRVSGSEAAKQRFLTKQRERAEIIVLIGKELQGLDTVTQNTVIQLAEAGIVTYNPDDRHRLTEAWAPRVTPEAFWDPITIVKGHRSETYFDMKEFYKAYPKAKVPYPQVKIVTKPDGKIVILHNDEELYRHFPDGKLPEPERESFFARIAKIFRR